jgi:hypothetical protein
VAQGTILPIFELLARYFLKFVQKLQIEPTLRSFSVKPELIREFQVHRMSQLQYVHASSTLALIGWQAHSVVLALLELVQTREEGRTQHCHSCVASHILRVSNRYARSRLPPALLLGGQRTALRRLRVSLRAIRMRPSDSRAASNTRCAFAASSADWLRGWQGNRFAYLGNGFALRELEERDMGYYLDDYRAEKPFLFDY